VYLQVLRIVSQDLKKIHIDLMAGFSDYGFAQVFNVLNSTDSH